MRLKSALNIFTVFFSYLIFKVASNTCATATTQPLCVAITCDGVWDPVLAVCNDCSFSQPICETSW